MIQRYPMLSSRLRHQPAAVASQFSTNQQSAITAIKHPSAALSSGLYAGKWRRLRRQPQRYGQVSSSCRFKHRDDEHDIEGQAELLAQETQRLQLQQQQQQQQPSDIAPPPVHVLTQHLQHDSRSLDMLDTSSNFQPGGFLTPHPAPSSFSTAAAAAAATPAAAAAAAEEQVQINTFAVPVAGSAPPVTSERLNMPPDSLSLKSPKQLLASAAGVFRDPFAPVNESDSAAIANTAPSPEAAAGPAGTAAAHVTQEDGGAPPAAAEELDSTPLSRVPYNSLSSQSSERLLMNLASSFQQVRDVGLDAVLEAANAATSALYASARSAVLAAAAAVLSAISVGAVGRKQLSGLDLGDVSMDNDASVGTGNSASAAQFNTVSSSNSSGSSSSSGATNYGIGDNMLVTAGLDAVTYLDGEDELVLIKATSSSGGSSSNGSSSSSILTPIANLEQSRIEVTKQLNLKREIAAQRIMKRTEIFVNRLRDSARETGKELGPIAMRNAVALIGRRTVVDAVKVLGRRNAAVGIGAVGGENAAAATEQLGVGGFAEITGIMGPQGVYQMVEKLGPIESMKMGRKLVTDNADMAVNRLRKSVTAGKGVKGFLQQLVLGLVWWGSVVCFGLFAMGKAIMQGFVDVVARVGGDSGSTPRPDMP